ncbi:hypothetical protein CWC29_022595 [Pseudoalteromonas sp. S4498]|uniref:hypothetical protein n=1 Tax=Pseudoalteromonas galatheae TaxID=579562 RepID=UPI001109EDA0|nr:hypothetical protein [Pseudoalteromonas galatheae]NKC21569.1 hypothetical protein [Pseudoalteromonas galatheae]
MLRSHLKIFKPQRLGSAPNAGGHRTNNAVVSGKLNDVFSSISDVDHARSAFDLVKLYPAVATDDATKLSKAHVFIADQPEDPLVHTLLVESPNLRDDSLLEDMLELMTASTIKYHGLSHLVAPYEQGELTLKLKEVHRSLAPTVKRVETKQGLRPATETIYKYKKVESFGNLREYNIDVPDILQSYNANRFLQYRFYRGNNNGPGDYYDKITYTVNNSTLSGTTVSGSLPPGHFVFEGDFLWLYYLSNQDFRFHSFSDGPDLNLGSTETVVPKTVRLKKQGSSQVITDDGIGRFIHSGYVIARIDYDTGVITEIEPIDYQGTVSEELGALIQRKPLTLSELQFSLPSSKFSRSSIYIRAKSEAGVEFSASSDDNGNITGTNISGSVNSTGVVELQFTVDVLQDSISYDYDEVTEINVPSPPGGIDRSKLPEGGYVPIFHEFNLVCVQERNRTQHPTLSNGQELTVTANANWVDIVDNDGLSLYSANHDNYSYDEDTGKVTIKPGIANFSGPFIITTVLSELVLVDAIDGDTLKILSPLKRPYNVGATVSSTYVLGDLQALTKDERTLSAWQNNFGDFGSPASSAINTTQYPIELSNLGTIAQRWAIVFTSTTAFYVVGEHVGTIYNGDITSDCTPINANAGSPFFVLRKEAFGAGLNPGEAFLFETTTASKPVMLTRSVSPGHTEIKYDKSTLGFRGSKD